MSDLVNSVEWSRARPLSSEPTIAIEPMQMTRVELTKPRETLAKAGLPCARPTRRSCTRSPKRRTTPSMSSRCPTTPPRPTDRVTRSTEPPCCAMPWTPARMTHSPMATIRKSPMSRLTRVPRSTPTSPPSTAANPFTSDPRITMRPLPFRRRHRANTRPRTHARTHARTGKDSPRAVKTRCREGRAVARAQIRRRDGAIGRTSVTPLAETPSLTESLHARRGQVGILPSVNANRPCPDTKEVCVMSDGSGHSHEPKALQSVEEAPALGMAGARRA